MLKRPKARDIMADVFPENTNDWTPCLKFYERVSANHADGHVLLLGSLCASVALWFAIRGHKVSTAAQNDELYDLYGVSERISYSSESSGLPDIVCICDDGQRSSLLEEELQRFEKHILQCQALIISSPQAHTSLRELESRLTQNRDFHLANEMTYGLVWSGSRGRYIRHLKVLINESIGRVMPCGLLKMKFQVFNRNTDG